MKKPFHSILLLVSSILLFSQFLPIGDIQEVDHSTVESKINLVLRQVGHQLLSIEKNDTAQIPPIEKNENGWHRLKLESKFNYDTLPYLLDKALETYELDKKYQVNVRDCQEENVILGYNYQAFLVKEVACIGRDQSSNCNIIEVMLLSDEQAGGFPYRFLLGLLGLIGLGWYIKSVVFDRKNANPPVLTTSETKETIAIGTLAYDYKNQLIKATDLEKTLTFRENKLLFLLASHPNQVLERERILQEVWGDEGVIVGRSLDVFISRLRKILKVDPAVQIKSIHGVGYKLVF